MKALIKGEEIRLDNHHINLPFDWDSSQDIHIHKTTNMDYDGKQISVDAKISINSNRGVLIVANKEQTHKRELIREKMIEEIKDAFENPHNRKIARAFVKDLIDELQTINKKKSPKIVEESFDRIMNYFGLNEKAGTLLTNEKENFLKKYRDSEREYYIRMEKDSISIGEIDRDREKLLKKLGFTILRND